MILAFASWLQEGASGWTSLVPWLLVLLLLAAAGLGALLWIVVARLAELLGTARSAAADVAELRGRVERLGADREDLDLRRLEHRLADLVEGHKRLEVALVAAVGRRADPEPRAPRAAAESASPEDRATHLVERVENRLFAMGYELPRVVGDREALAVQLEGRGEVLVEARRAGVLHKGRVLLRDGRIADVELRPPYTMFP